MTEQRRSALKELQRLDERIEAAKEEVREFDPLFADVEEPALMLESELGTTRSRLQEMKLAERRLELSTEEKGVRVKRLEERLGGVRNLREEAAVSAELEMVRRALQSDEQEALTLIDQIRKLEERQTELEEAYGEAQELVEPRMNELVERRSVVKEKLAALEKERADYAAGMDDSELRLYEAIRAGGRSVAVAALTEDGACGHCFGMIPLQLQNEIRHGTELIRCEGCGVILTAPEPPGAEPEEPEEAEAEAEEAEAAETEAEADAADSEPDDAADEGDGDEEPSEVPAAAEADASEEEADETPAADGAPEAEADAEPSADAEQDGDGDAAPGEAQPSEPSTPEPVRAGAIVPDEADEADSEEPEEKEAE